MKSLLLVDEIFQSHPVHAMFSDANYRVDRYRFGARDRSQNRLDDLGKIIEKLRAHQYDAVVLGNPPEYWNPRKNAVRNVARLQKRWRDLPAFLGCERIFRALEKEGRTPLYVVDQMDSPVIDNSKFRFLDRCAKYFKRELPSNIVNVFLYTTDKTESPDSILHNAWVRPWAHKLRPISLGISDEQFERAAAVKTEKKLDLFFSGEFTNRVSRRIGRDALRRLEGDGFRVHITEQHYPEDEFHELCAQSLLCWSPEGFGTDCHRHYEIAACGSVPLRKHSPLFPYAPLRENIECVYYAHETCDLYDAARKALSDPDQLRRMGRHAQERVRDYHRHSCLAEYVLGDSDVRTPPVDQAL
jgi:hypothetical protein